MSTEAESEVKDIEVVDTESQDDQDHQESSTDGGDVTDEPSQKETEAQEEHSVPQKPNTVSRTDDALVDDLATVEGETPRERALRLEVTRLRGVKKAERVAEIGIQTPVFTKKEKTSETSDILSKYNPDELAALREVMPVLAEELGFVRADQLRVQKYSDDASGELERFFDSHKEYLPENDRDGALWDAFKAEFYGGTYNTQPSDPKILRKIFAVVHEKVSGIHPSDTVKGKTSAQQHKVSVASHAGTSGLTSSRRTKEQQSSQELRFDMLKGFTEAEIAELRGE